MKLIKLKKQKNLKALTAALACGIVFTMGGQAYAEPVEPASATNAAKNAMGTIVVGTGTGDVVITNTEGAVDAKDKDVWGFQATAEKSEAPNKVELQSGSVNTVVGIMATTNAASKGNVIVSGGSSTGGVYGVCIETDASTSTAADGTVSVTGGGIGSSTKIYGIYNKTTNASASNSTSTNGTVTISSLDVASSVNGVYGIYAEGDNKSTAQNGTVNLNAGTYERVYGILAQNGCAASNGKVIVSGGSVSGQITGISLNTDGEGSTNTADGGTVSITGGTLTGGYSGKIYGIENSISYASSAADSTSTNGKVIISSLDADSSMQYIYGIKTNHNAENGSVEINSDKFTSSTGTIYGIYSDAYRTSTVKNGTVKLTAGKYYKVVGIHTESACGASGGKVVASNCTINSSVYGMEIFSEGSNKDAAVTNGKVVLDNVAGLSTSPVYGIYSSANPAKGAEIIICNTDIGNLYGIQLNNSKSAKDVTIRLVGKGGSYKDSDCDLTGTKGITINNLQPAYSWTSEGSYENNTLDIYGYDVTVGSILGLASDAATTNLHNLNFYIPASAMDAEGSKTMLTLTSNTNLSAVNIKAGVTNVGEVAKDSKIALISTGSNTLTVDESKCSSMAVSDGIMNVELKLYTTQADGTEVAGASGDARKLMAKALADSKASGSDGQASEQAKSPVETQAAGVSLLNQGSDMLAVAGLDNAAEAAGQAGEAGSVSSMAPFAAMGGSNQRIHSGSYVDMKAWNINLGLAKEVTNKYGKLLFGPMLEYGHGSYDSYLDDGTHGSGKSKFFGGGLFAKESYHDGLYVEGSLRAGRAKNDYRAIIADKDMSYDNSATYLAAHLGVGKEVALNEKDNLDYYGKLFYSHQNSSRATLKAGYTYDFDAVDSFRTRIGARYTHKLNDFNKIYAGLAWQHEFDSKCRATIHAGDWTNEAPSPSVKGDTGILELGWKVKPGKGNFETGLGFTGSIGKQEGIGFNASFQWNF